MEKLASYMTDKGLTGRAFAAMVGVHPSIVSKLLGADLRPSLHLAVKIERATDGFVPVAAWLDKPRKQAAV